MSRIGTECVYCLLFIASTSLQVKTFLNKKRNCLLRKYKRPTIANLLDQLQDIVDFEVLDTHLIFDCSGKYRSNNHPAWVKFVEILHQKIQEDSDRASEADDVIVSIQESNLVPFSYEGSTGEHLCLTGSKLRAKVQGYLNSERDRLSKIRRNNG